jgi:hypothetical protein
MTTEQEIALRKYKKLNLNQLSSIRIAKEDLDKQFYICLIW